MIMILYLCAQKLSIVKIGGSPVFTICEKPEKIEIDINSPPLIEISELNTSSANFCFYPNHEFFTHPPIGVILTKIPSGYHLFIKENYSLLPFKVITQKKTDDAVITVFCDRGYKISIETLLDYYLQDIDCTIESAEIFDIDQNKNVFINLIGSENTLCAFNLKEKIKPVFLKNVFSFELIPALTTTEKFPTHLKHIKKCCWEYLEDAFSLKSINLETERQLNIEQIGNNILPYVFLEGLFMGENVQNYLCDSLIPHKEKLFSYLGDFVGVFPPTPDADQNLVGLLYKERDNAYQTKYVKVDVQNKKVINVKLIEN